MAYWLGIDYGPTALFLFFNVVTVFILIHFSIQLSDYKTKKRILAQEVALLRDQVEELSRKMGIAMNLLTFDIEDWYHINYPLTDFEHFDRQEDHRSLVERLRGILTTLSNVPDSGGPSLSWGGCWRSDP